MVKQSLLSESHIKYVILKKWHSESTCKIVCYSKLRQTGELGAYKDEARSMVVLNFIR